MGQLEVSIQITIWITISWLEKENGKNARKLTNMSILAAHQYLECNYDFSINMETKHFI